MPLHTAVATIHTNHGDIVVNLFGDHAPRTVQNFIGLSDGSQGVDLSVFPSLALDQVEVLRDGAAAQYGSDAIAGVINFGLKRLNGGGQVEIFGGEYYEGDGETIQTSGQIGLPIGQDGFATLTAEWREADATSRSVQRDDAAAAAAAGYPNVPDPAQIWGSPEVKDDRKFVANFGWQGENLESVGEVEEFFARACFEADQRLGEPAACRWFLNWFDDTPRDQMRRELLAEVELALAERLPIEQTAPQAETVARDQKTAAA